MSTTGHPAGHGIEVLSWWGDFGLSGALQSLPVLATGHFFGLSPRSVLDDFIPLVRYAKPSDDSYSLVARSRSVLASAGWGRFV